MSSFLYSYGLSLTQLLGKRLKPKKTASTPKRIHNFRLTVKRLRALIRLLDSISHEPSHGYLFKPFKKVYRKTGYLRDLHVQWKLIKYLKSQSPKEANILLKSIEKKEISNSKEVNRQFLKLDSKGIKNILEYFEEHLASGFKISFDDYNSFISQKIGTIKNLIGTDYEDHTLHDIRKQLKELVYTLEVLQIQNFNLDIPDETIEWLNNLQEKLGKWNDWYNLTLMLKGLNSGKVKFLNIEWLCYIEKDKFKQSITDCLQKISKIEIIQVKPLENET